MSIIEKSQFFRLFFWILLFVILNLFRVSDLEFRVLSAEAAGLSGYAWSENIGWVKFNGANYGVMADTATGELSGFAWSENIGWVRFDPPGPYPYNPAYSGRYDVSDNKFKGWARSCAATADPRHCGTGNNPDAGGWEGWLKLSGNGYSVEQVGNATAGCFLNGYAWGGMVIGWLKFSGQNYQVTISDCLTGGSGPPPPPGLLSCAFTASPTRILSGNSSILDWRCQNAANCSIAPGIGSVNRAGGSRSVRPSQTTTYTLTCDDGDTQTTELSQTIAVIRSTICEVIPWFPGCP